MPSSNYYWGVFRNELNWGIATYYENPMAQTFLTDALVTRWQNSFLPYASSGDGRGGVADEGSAYGQVMDSYPMVPFETSKLLGRDLFTETNFYKEALFQTIYATTPAPTGGSYMLFPFGDDENGSQFLNRNYLGDFMTTVANEWASVPAGQYARQWLNMVNPPMDKYVAATDQGGSALSFNSLPTDYYAPGAQYLYTRDQWGAQGTELMLQLGQPGGQHEHLDAGSFQIWSNGQWLSKESTGYVTQFADGTNSQGSSAHNTILFNGMGQAPGWADGPPQVLRLQSAADFSYAAVNLTPAYKSSSQPVDDNPYVSHAEREFIYIKSLKTLVTLDRLDSTSANVTKTFLLHFPNSPTIQGNTVTGVNGNQALKLTSLTSGAMFNVSNEGPNGQYRLAENVSGPAQSYILNVMQAKNVNGPDVAVAMTEDATSWTINLDSATLGHAVIVLQKGMATTGGSIGYSATGTPTTQTGLLNHVQSTTVTDNGPQWGV
jgi:hypothetical protein